MAARRIGQVFVDLGFITDDQLEMLLEEQQQNPGQLLGKMAIDMGLIGDDHLAQALSEQLSLPFLDLEGVEYSKESLEMLPKQMAELYRVVPIRFENGVLHIATGSPEDLSVQDELRRFLDHPIELIVAAESQVLAALNKYYGDEYENLETIIKDVEEDKKLQRAAEAVAKDGPIALGEVDDLVNSAPVRKLLNMVLLLAIRDHASDIHFEPFQDEFRIRIKSDGVLYEMVPPPRHLAFAITTRIKVMANLDIAERRMPQDGRIELDLGGHPVDLRVSVLPTIFGESVVMRVLDRSVVELSLSNVGMNEETITTFRAMLKKPNGIVLVTGPTGSGKTTTLYSALSEMNNIEDKLITTEDPVEYDIDGIVQIPIDHEIGVTFSQCLRAILRQDPDIILVGEIRDLETAEIAVQAALTGHMVFSTLHTNDAPSTIVRMKDMGIKTFLITACVEAILAQRLVRRICSGCKTETEPNEALLREIKLTPAEIEGKTFYRGAGCEGCNNTGYKGRVGLFELMVMDDELREMIMNNANADELRDRARAKGMVTLRDSGISFVFSGMTTVEEIARETVVD